MEPMAGNSLKKPEDFGTDKERTVYSYEKSAGMPTTAGGD